MKLDSENWEICGEDSFDCPDYIDDDSCDSGKAFKSKSLGLSLDSPISINNCSYNYYVEYACEGKMNFWKDKLKFCSHVDRFNALLELSKLLSRLRQLTMSTYIYIVEHTNRWFFRGRRLLFWKRNWTLDLHSLCI